MPIEAWARQLLEPTERNFESECMLWTVSKERNQRCEINQSLCPTVPSDWMPSNINGVIMWSERSRNQFADSAFMFEREKGMPNARTFPFVLAMAHPFSALIQTLVSTSSRAGAQLDKVFYIPTEVTEDPAVMECLLFYIYTGFVVDVRALTKEGTNSIFQSLTHEAVSNTEFSFDIMVSLVASNSTICDYCIGSEKQARIICRSFTTWLRIFACTSLPRS